MNIPPRIKDLNTVDRSLINENSAQGTMVVPRFDKVLYAKRNVAER